MPYDCYVDPDMYPPGHPLRNAECLVHQRRCKQCGQFVDVCIVHDEQGDVCPACGGEVNLGASRLAWERFSLLRLSGVR